MSALSWQRVHPGLEPKLLRGVGGKTGRPPRTDHLRGVITTDLPQTYAAPETAPIEMDEDLTRGDAWMFGPLLAAAVALPIAVTTLLGFSAWNLIDKQASLSSPPPATFATRWPDQELPTVIR